MPAVVAQERKGFFAVTPAKSVKEWEGERNEKIKVLAEGMDGVPIKSSRSSSIASVNSTFDLSSPSSATHSRSIQIPISDKISSAGLRDQTFPELLEAYRLSAKDSKDPAFKMTYVDYLFGCAEKVLEDAESLGIFFDVADERSAEDRKQLMHDTMVAEAMKWLKRLATKGICPFTEAQFLLAELYGRGVYGLKVNHGKAFALYLAASKQNHPAATYRTAVCYEMGAGVKKDNARASQFYRKAAAAGDELAMHKYALMLLYGHLGMKRNLKDGISWLKRTAAVATSEYPQSLMDLARLFEKDSGCPMVIPDEGYSLELYKKAANFGYAPAQYRLGTCHEFGLLGCARDPQTALRWYAKAADQEFAEAELALSHWYLTGTPATALEDPENLANYILIKPSETEAFEWAQRAANRGLPKAQYTLGYYYEEGIGCEEDFGSALLWYRRSAEQQYHRALKRLAEMKVPYKNKKSGPFKCTIQ